MLYNIKSDNKIQQLFKSGTLVMISLILTKDQDFFQNLSNSVFNECSELIE